VLVIGVQPAHHHEAVERLVSWPETTYVSSISGRADIIIQLVCATREDLWRVITEKMPTIPGVTAMETFMELKLHKFVYTTPAPTPQHRGR
jgi:Lrp/AsnC family transcriptional regulator for asnA, asnC and gidA